MGRPPRRERAARVERRAGMAFAPGVHQCVGRAGVETAHGDPVAAARQQGEVADAAEVQHRALLARGTQQGGMEGRHQRCTMAAGGHVAAAEVGHRVDAAAFGDHVAVTDLPGEGRLGVRTMADGLAVRTDRADVTGGNTGLAEQAQGRFGEVDAGQCVQPSHLVQ